MDAKSIAMVLTTAALGACAVIMVCKGEFEHAFVFGSLLVPSAGQIPHATLTTTAKDGPEAATAKVSE